MTRLARAGAAVSAGLGAWCALGAVAVGPGTTTASRVAALPPPWVLGVLTLGFLAFTLGARVPAARTAPLFGALACVLPYVPGPLPPALLAWQGLLAVLVWLGIAVAVVGAEPVPHAALAAPLAARLWRDPKVAPIAAGIVAAATSYCAWRGAASWVPGGDEPHYLVITQSLLLDGDLRIENNHERGDYAAYYGGVLRPDFIKRGTDGQIYSVHAPGISAVVLPAFALGGYQGVVLFLVGAFGLGAALAWRLAWRVTGDATAAWVGWSATALSWPVLAQSFEIYPDGFGGILVLVGVWALLEAPAGPAWRLAAGGAALAALPWMHTRMALLPAALGAAILVRLLGRHDRWRALAAFTFMPSLSAIAWFSFFKLIYGAWNPAAPYGDDYRTHLYHAATGIPGILFDQQFGLLTAAPSFVVAFAGAAIVVSQRHLKDTRRLVVELAIGFVPYGVAVAAYPMWFGGASAPARFVASILPAAIVPIALAWVHARSPARRTAIVGLIVVSLCLTCCAFWVEDGQFAISQRAPFSPLLQWATRAADLPTAVPSILRGNVPLASVQAAVWLGALVIWAMLLEALGTRRSRVAALAVPLGVVVGSAAMASSWAASRQDGLSVQPSRAALLQVAWPDGLGLAIGADARALTGRVIGPVASVLAAVPLEGEGRRAPQADAPVPFGPVPAGRYRIEVDPAAGGELRVSSGGGPALATLSLASEGRPDTPPAVEFDVPLPMNSLGVDLIPRGPRVPFRLLAVALERSVAASGIRARQAARYGDVTAFLPSDRQFVEREGMWLRPGTVPMVLQASHDAAAVRLGVRNTPIGNTLDVATKGWQVSRSLSADEEVVIDVPLQPGQRAAYVEFRVAAGIRPMDLDRASEDTRTLGVWLTFPR